MQKEVKIINIYEAKEKRNSFIEFMLLSDGKKHILKYENFIKRYDEKLLDEITHKSL